jgi:DNA polymerase-3 subunit gamma/tau
VRIAELLATLSPAELLKGVQALEQFAPDYTQLLDELAGLLVRVGLRQAVGDYEGDEVFAPEVLERLARALTAEDVQLFYQTAITGKRDLPLAPDPRTGFEMTLLRMVAFRPAGASGGQRAAAPGGGRPPAEAARTPGAAPVSGAATLASAPGSGEAAPGPWAAIVSSLELSGAARQLANHCALLARQGAVVRLALDPHNQQLRTPAQEEKLTQALSRHFGEPVRLEFQSTGAPGETPALLAQRASQAELAQARQAFEADPGVQGLRERFGATVLPDTVRPVK